MKKEMNIIDLQNLGFNFVDYPTIKILKNKELLFSANETPSGCCGVSYFFPKKITNKKIKHLKDAIRYVFDSFFQTWICTVLQRKKDEKLIKFLKNAGFKESKQFKDKTKIMLKYRQDH